jgi:hypothetical protein
MQHSKLAKTISKTHDFVVVSERKEGSTSDEKMGAPGVKDLGSKTGRKGGGMSLPPALTLFPPRVLRIQYSAGGNGNVSPTVANILTAGGVIATSSTTATAVHTACRIRKLTVWPSPSGSATDAVDLFWVGDSGNVPDQEKARAVPAGVTVTGPTVFRPPAKSLASFWWSSADPNTQLFTITVSASHDIIEAEIEYCQAVNFTTQSMTSSGLTVTNMYYSCLDGHSGILFPSSLANAP